MIQNGLTKEVRLSPKIKSLIKLHTEMEITAGIITESWPQSGSDLDGDLLDLELGTALKIFYKNRHDRARRTERYLTKPKRGKGLSITVQKSL